MIRGGDERNKSRIPTLGPRVFLISNLCIDYRSGFEAAFGYRGVVGPTLVGTFVVGQSSRRIGEGKRYENMNMM